MQNIKGPSGFGDAIYTRAIVEWMLKNKSNIYNVQTRYPNIFSDLTVTTSDLNFHGRVDYDCKYIYQKTNQETTQFEDMLNSAKLPQFELTSYLANPDAVKDKTIVIEPYAPMNGVVTSLSMKPDEQEFFNYVCSHDNIFSIDRQYAWNDLIDIFNSAKLVISQQGWAIALSEMLNIPVVAIFTKRALESDNKFISTITPRKIITKSTTTSYIME